MKYVVVGVDTDPMRTLDPKVWGPFNSEGRANRLKHQVERAEAKSMVFRIVEMVHPLDTL